MGGGAQGGFMSIEHTQMFLLVIIPHITDLHGTCIVLGIMAELSREDLERRGRSARVLC